MIGELLAGPGTYAVLLVLGVATAFLYARHARGGYGQGFREGYELALTLVEERVDGDDPALEPVRRFLREELPR